VIDAIEADFSRECAAILEKVRGWFTAAAAFGSAFGEKRSPAGMERSLLDSVQSAGAERWAAAAVTIEEDVCAAADRLSDRMSEDLKVQMREELRPDPVFWEAQRHRFVTRVGEILEASVHRTALERFLEPIVAQTRKGAAAVIVVGTAVLIGGIVLAVQQYWTLAGTVLGVGAVFTVIMAGMWKRTLRLARQATEEHLAAAAPELRAQFVRQLREDVRGLYESFSRVLLPTREKLAEQEARHTSLQGQLHAMEQAFHALDRELASLVTATPR
jgi:hypothetical protein